MFFYFYIKDDIGDTDAEREQAVDNNQAGQDASRTDEGKDAERNQQDSL